MDLKELYRGMVPEQIRNPLGAARRGLQDRLRRALSSDPLPPRELLLRIQMTPWIAEYLQVGSQAAEDVRAALGEAGFGSDRRVRLLDLGCGCARVTRHLTGPGWEVHGCDVDADAIAWAADAVRGARFVVNGATPPLPYADGSLDVVVAVSVFTHFPVEEQRRWSREVGRCLARDGVLVLSTMGVPLLRYFEPLPTPENVATLERDGFLFVDAGPRFNDRAAFHTREGVSGLFAPDLVLEQWRDRGLAGFQDLSVLRRRAGGLSTPPSPSRHRRRSPPR